jgi:hypothetical protein
VKTSTGSKTHKDDASRVRIESRRAEMTRLIMAGHTQADVAERLGISRPHVCNELKAMVREWREEYLGDIDQRRAVEYQRALHVLSLCLEEFEFSKVRQVYPKDKAGNPDTSKKPQQVRVSADPEWMTHVRGLLELICKVRGVTEQTTNNNTVNVFSLGDLVKELRASREAPQNDRLAEVERMQAALENKGTQQEHVDGTQED